MATADACVPFAQVILKQAEAFISFDWRSNSAAPSINAQPIVHLIAKMVED